MGGSTPARQAGISGPSITLGSNWGDLGFLHGAEDGESGVVGLEGSGIGLGCSGLREGSGLEGTDGFGGSGLVGVGGLGDSGLVAGLGGSGLSGSGRVWVGSFGGSTGFGGSAGFGRSTGFGGSAGLVGIPGLDGSTDLGGSSFGLGG